MPRTAHRARSTDHAKPAYAFAGLFALCWFVGRMNPYWTGVLTALVVLAVVWWIATVLIDIFDPPFAQDWRLYRARRDFRRFAERHNAATPPANAEPRGHA